MLTVIVGVLAFLSGGFTGVFSICLMMAFKNAQEAQEEETENE